MQICQGVAEINGMTLHYKSAKNLTLCQCKFNGRFLKITPYVNIHDTQPGGGSASIQLPSITDHSSSACVAAGLCTHLWYLIQQHTGLIKSTLTLLLHNRNTMRHQNSIQEQLLQFSRTQHGYSGSPPVEHTHMSSDLEQPLQPDTLACVSSDTATLHVCVCMCACVHSPSQTGHNSSNCKLSCTSVTVGYAKSHLHVALRSWECAHGLLPLATRRAQLLKLYYLRA